MIGLLTVIVKPARVADAIKSDWINTQALVLVVLGIDFLLTLLLLPMAHEAVRTAMLKHPEISNGMSWLILAFSVLFGSLINMALTLIVALLVFLATAVFEGGNANYGRLFEAVLLGSAPLVLSRSLRTVGQALQWRHGDLLTLSDLMNVCHLPAPQWLQAMNIGAFDFWSLLLFEYLYSRVSGLGRGLSYTIVTMLWCLLQIVSFRLLGK